MVTRKSEGSICLHLEKRNCTGCCIARVSAKHLLGVPCLGGWGGRSGSWEPPRYTANVNSSLECPRPPVMPDGEAESTALSPPAQRPRPGPPWQLDSPSPVPGLPAPAQICFGDSGRMGPLARATPAQPALLPLPLLWRSMTSSNWASPLDGGKCPSFKSNWLQTS